MDAITFPTCEELENDLQGIFRLVISELLEQEVINELGGTEAMAHAYEAQHFGSIGQIHDYAVNGRAGSRDGVIPLMSIIWGISGLCQRMGGSLASSDFKALANAEALYTARAKLDGEKGMGFAPSPLDVSDIAVLAGISEAAVRNAISRKELATFKDGNATLIESPLALEWLKKRRAFRRTVFTDADEVFYLEDVDSRESLARYLAFKREHGLGCDSVESLIAEQPDIGLSQSEVESLEAEVLKTPITKYEMLARLYKEEGAKFMEMMLKVFHAEQYEEITAGAATMEDIRFEGYERDQIVENRYGGPDFDVWRLYQQAESFTNKGAVVRAMHIILSTAGKDLDYARDVLNTYTLALYKKGESGEYASDAYKNMRSYSEKPIYGFLYDLNCEFKATKQDQRNSQLNATHDALETPWAVRLMAQEGVSKASVMTWFDELMQRWG